MAKKKLERWEELYISTGPLEWQADGDGLKAEIFNALFVIRPSRDGYALYERHGDAWKRITEGGTVEELKYIAELENTRHIELRKKIHPERFS